MPTRVLVVDDNELLVENLAELLTDEGYETRTAQGPADAIAQARNGFDVALMDVRMPGMDGVSLFAELRARQPDATYLLMTAYTRDERIAEAMDEGIGVVLPKPIPIRSLLAHLPTPDGDGQAEGVLVVEDETALAASLVSVLRHRGFDAQAVGTVGAARRALAARPQDAIVCDVGLPDGDGASFANEVCQEKGLAIVMITGLDATQQVVVRDDCKDHARVLTKPFSPRTLVDTLEELGHRGSGTPPTE